MSFLMKAKTLKKENPFDYFKSEKLDGMRCLWDGGVTTGMQKTLVPWANNDKDTRYVTEPIATGLWSQYGNTIHAPQFFIDALPKGIVLEGELYIGRNKRQLLMSIIKKLTPCEYDWRQITFRVFDAPPVEVIFNDRIINETHYKKTFSGICDFLKGKVHFIKWSTYFGFRLAFAQKEVPENDYVKFVEQEILTGTAKDVIAETLEELSLAGAEGLMLHNRLGLYQCKRTNALFKVKKLEDAEGTVVGFTAGLEGKLYGKMGAIILDYDGHRLEISGFTDKERGLSDSKWALDEPGTDIFEDVANHFRIGDSITFKYRGLSTDGIPQEARYWRKSNQF